MRSNTTISALLVFFASLSATLHAQVQHPDEDYRATLAGHYTIIDEPVPQGIKHSSDALSGSADIRIVPQLSLQIGFTSAQSKLDAPGLISINSESMSYEVGAMYHHAVSHDIAFHAGVSLVNVEASVKSDLFSDTVVTLQEDDQGYALRAGVSYHQTDLIVFGGVSHRSIWDDQVLTYSSSIAWYLTDTFWLGGALTRDENEVSTIGVSLGLRL